MRHLGTYSKFHKCIIHVKGKRMYYWFSVRSPVDARKNAGPEQQQGRHPVPRPLTHLSSTHGECSLILIWDYTYLYIYTQFTSIYTIQYIFVSIKTYVRDIPPWDVICMYVCVYIYIYIDRYCWNINQQSIWDYPGYMGFCKGGIPWNPMILLGFTPFFPRWNGNLIWG